MMIGLIVSIGRGVVAWMAGDLICETSCLSELGEDPSAKGFLWVVTVSEQTIMTIRVIKDKRVSVTWARSSSSVSVLEPS
jgi:hypothetical protein